MSESMADFEKEIDESLKTLNVVENEGEAPEEETGFNAWDKVQQYLEDGTVLSLKIGGIVNKGVIVYVDGLRGFIPASHLEIGYVEDTNPYLGKTVEAKVITADPEKNRLVLSVKEVLYDKKRAEKEQRINAIEAGAVLTGKVESLMPYGAFIDLGDDISGLVHISQIAQKRIESPAEVLKVGQEVNVKVLKVENGKISLSMKALEEVAPEELSFSFDNADEVQDENSDYIKLTKASRYHFCLDSEDYTGFLKILVNAKLRNAIGHNDVEYNSVDQLITYIPNLKDRTKKKTECL